jgi:hypothetical protein
MRRVMAIVVLCGISTAVWGCGNSLEPARDLTGTWLGIAPNGALYEDNVANPNCRYEADLRITLAQDGNSLAGSLQLTVRESEKLLSTSLPCVPVGTSSNQALFGEVGTSRVNFTLIDGVTVFSGTFTSDILRGDFVTNVSNGVIGTFTVQRD